MAPRQTRMLQDPLRGPRGRPPSSAGTGGFQSWRDDLRVVRLGCACVSMVCLAASWPAAAVQDAPPWLPGGWACRREIRIEEGFYFLGDDLRDFPLQVAIDAADDPVFARACADGHFRFRAADGVTPLDHETELFQTGAASCRLVCWVRIPLIRAEGDTRFYLYYGNPNAYAPATAAARGVWTNGYAGVWHFGGATPETVGRSATGRGDGTVSRGTVEPAAPGVVGTGVRFGADGLIDCGPLPGIEALWRSAAVPVPEAQATRPGAIWQSFTLETWIRYEEHPERGARATRGILSPPHFPLFRHEAWRWQGQFAPPGAASLHVFSRDPYPEGEWRHLALRYDAPRGELALFVDGALAAGGAGLAVVSAVAAELAPFSRPMTIGDDRIGTLDEARFSVVARSDDWLRLSYLNQKSPQLRIRVGKQEER